MKKGMCHWAMFGNSKDMKKEFQVFREAGFDGVELGFGEQGPVSLKSSKADLKKVRKAAEEAGVELAGLTLGILWGYPLTSNDRGKAAKGKTIVRRALKAAAELGIDTILVIPGLVNAPFIGPDIVSYDVAYKRALSAVKELSKDAEKARVNIGVENVWNKFLLSPLEMADFIDKTGSRYVGCYFDVGNVLVSGFPEQWIRILGKRVKKIHLKDFRCNVGNINGFCNLLEGDVNWPEVIKALKDVGYDDFLIAEMFVGKHYPESLIRQTSLAMDYILGKVK